MSCTCITYQPKSDTIIMTNSTKVHEQINCISSQSVRGSDYDQYSVIDYHMVTLTLLLKMYLPRLSSKNLITCDHKVL